MDKRIIPIFTGLFVQDKDELKGKYTPVYEKQYYDHVTKQFKPGEISRSELGTESEVHIIGRLSTPKVDVLLVDVVGTQNEFPHITLSTAEGVLPKESNEEIKNNQDKIIPLDDHIKVKEGAFLRGGGIDYGINFSLNTKHNRIVSGQNIDYEILKKRDEIKPVKVEYDGIQFLAVGKYYEENNQYIGHQLKDGDPKSVDYAAYQMSKLVPENAVLVPVPGHNGTTDKTAILAQAISSYVNVPVIDVLRGKERESQYEAKYNGRPLTAEQMGIRKTADIPEGKTPVVVDGVVDTGTTGRAAIEALDGKGIILSFAMSDTLINLDAMKKKESRVKKVVTDFLIHKISSINGLELVMNTQEDGQKIAEIQEVNPENAELMQVFHGSSAAFEHFDSSHFLEGQGNMYYGAGHYVTTSKSTGKTYAEIAAQSAKANDDASNYTNPIDIAASKLRSWMNGGYNFSFAKNKAIKEIQDTMAFYKEDTDAWEQTNNILLAFDNLTENDIKKDIKRYLYSVEIPDDDGQNYIDWNEYPTTDVKQKASKELYVYVINNDSEGLYNTNSAREQLKQEIEDALSNNFIDGGNLYCTVSSYLGNDLQTSKFFSKLGYKGIKMAIDNPGTGEEPSINFVIFNDNDIKIQERIEFMENSQGIVYGWSEGNKIHLTPEGLNPNTPIHEYTHLWVKAIQKQNPELWVNIKSLLKDNPLIQKVLSEKNYKGLSEDGLYSEALARVSGENNSEKIEAAARSLIEEGYGETEIMKMLSDFKQAVNQLWEWIGKNMFGIKKFESLEEVTDRILYDLISETDIFINNKGESEFMIIGQSGATVEQLHAQKIALSMSEQGYDALSIRVATGWERGADGVWKFEVPDGKILVNWKEKLHSIKHHGGTAIGLKLEDIYNNSELYTAYPKLKEVKVIVNNQMKPSIGAEQGGEEIFINGVFADDSKTMAYLDVEGKWQNMNKKDVLHSFIEHEIQHWIQHEEGFETGPSGLTLMRASHTEAERKYLAENPDINAMDLMDSASTLTWVIEDVCEKECKESFAEELKRKDVDDYYIELLKCKGVDTKKIRKEWNNAYLKEGERISDIWKDINEGKRPGLTKEQFDQLSKEGQQKIQQALGRYYKLIKANTEIEELSKSPELRKNYYWYSMGEVEARNVQNRIGMSEEQRRNTLLSETEDVKCEQQWATGAKAYKYQQSKKNNDEKSMNMDIFEKSIPDVGIDSLDEDEEEEQTRSRGIHR